MIVDTSAVVSVVFREEGFESILEKLLSPGPIGVGTPTLVETGVVLGARLRRDPRQLVGSLIEQFRITPIAFSEAHLTEALRAWFRFGRGRHAANLNFGDCLSYAVASLAGEPLLFVGDDFAATDVEVA